MMDQGASGYVVKNAIPRDCPKRGDGHTEQKRTFVKRLTISCIGFTQPIWLTRREKELLSLIVEGYTNVEIAEKMFLG